MHIAVIADRNMEIGLHVTLYSALHHLPSNTDCAIHLISDEYIANRLHLLKSTLSRFTGRYRLLNYSASEYEEGIGKAYMGNMMPYLKFQIPHLINADKVIYLDSDLIVLTDLAKLWDQNLNGNAIGASFDCTLDSLWLTKERVFLKSLDLPGNTTYFNSGVLLFSSDAWKSRRLTDKALSFCVEHSAYCFRGDQTVLNAVLRGQLKILPSKYNVPYPPADRDPLHSTDKDIICHFLASPKPWDLFGEFIHQSYPEFKKWLDRTCFQDWKSYKNLSVSQLHRVAHLSRSYFHTIKRRLQSV